jgi:hypothetical protein
MAAIKLIGIGLILLFSLPGLVAASEGRRTPNPFIFILAIGGLAWNWSAAGGHALLLSLASGILVFALLAGGIAFTQRRWNRRLLTGTNIKLMAAAATWLQPLLAIAAITAALIAIILWLSLKDTSPARQSRPDITPFLTIALLTVFTIS